MTATLADLFLNALDRPRLLGYMGSTAAVSGAVRKRLLRDLRASARYRLDPDLARAVAGQPMPLGALDAETGFRMPQERMWIELQSGVFEGNPGRFGLLAAPHDVQGFRLDVILVDPEAMGRTGAVAMSPGSVRFDFGLRIPDDPVARKLGITVDYLIDEARAYHAKSAGIDPEAGLQAYLSSPSGQRIEQDMRCTNIEMHPGVTPENISSAHNLAGLRGTGPAALSILAVFCTLLAERSERVVEHRDVAGVRRLAGRPTADRPVLSYRQAHIALPNRIEAVISEAASRSERADRKRQHECRGHWCESRRGRDDCDHNWEREAVQRWRCLACGRRRWWRRAHQRGSPELGRVNKDYRAALRPRAYA
ncbi:hypothetical protein CKO28_06005 [Rhodovibrio sodomensis]|uniref:Uncharacterized protein n=1 Tax=Rhodovibrio sodomensis TaxID=1088 RepID=A0ABS1DB25_9PROT|nr:hypothetical protein [Rhodovibrio sodomensis]MBK1667585.1 hypothetical protein [Rhodovibrio sodomensis]